jgi:hypothetical protein
MKFETMRKTVLLGAAAVFVWWAWKAPAQDTVTMSASAKVPYAVAQVVQLEQAKISDGTFIEYIRNSGNNYNLTANDILYLRQEGVSDAVLTAMLTQPKVSAAMANSYSQPVAPEPQYSELAPAPDTSTYADAASAQPSVAYVQSAPPTYYYPSSYYYPYSYSYPYYGYSGYSGWPGWGWGWWGGGWHWSWGWHGGWNTGWHGGGGFHGVVGGGFHGGGGGGWHGGGGGGFHGGGGHR